MKKTLIGWICFFVFMGGVFYTCGVFDGEQEVASVIIGTNSNGQTVEVACVAAYPMSYSEAKKQCRQLGDEWDLPLLEELRLMNKNKDKLSANGRTFGEQSTFYWSDQGKEACGEGRMYAICFMCYVDRERMDCVSG